MLCFPFLRQVSVVLYEVFQEQFNVGSVHPWHVRQPFWWGVFHDSDQLLLAIWS
jgi:hypothetical protein